jgi:UDP-2,3-diacylglucosamine hydrolase
MKRLFLSDLHLDDPQSAQFRTFAALLERECTELDELYLLGDLCEVWIGDDDDGPLAQALVEVLREAGRHARIGIMAGNRDFLFGRSFAAATGGTLLPDLHPLPGGILLAHGDTFCIDDQAYQSLRSVIRSPRWQQQVLDKPLDERRALARRMREESRANNANKPQNIMDANDGELARVMHQHGASTLIHGHTHRPGIHRAGWGVRYVLGAWDHCAWLLRETNGAFQIECRPFVL